MMFALTAWASRVSQTSLGISLALANTSTPGSDKVEGTGILVRVERRRKDQVVLGARGVEGVELRK